MTPVRINSQALLKRRWHDLHRLEDVDLADLILRGWHRREGLSWIELAGGRLMAFKEDLVVDKVAAAFAELLAGTLGRSPAWTVTADRRLVHLDRYNVLAPCVAVHASDERWLINPRHAPLIVDFVAGGNEERMRWGRRRYMKAGLRQHWLIDLTAGFIEIAEPGVDVYFRRDAEWEVPIVVDDLFYGSFRLSDVFTTA